MCRDIATDVMAIASYCADEFSRVGGAKNFDDHYVGLAYPEGNC